MIPVWQMQNAKTQRAHLHATVVTDMKRIWIKLCVQVQEIPFNNRYLGIPSKILHGHCFLSSSYYSTTPWKLVNSKARLHESLSRINNCNLFLFEKNVNKNDKECQIL